MGTCQQCHRSAKTISDAIGFCADCIRAHFEEVWPRIKRVHDHSRRAFGLPLGPPRPEHGLPCKLCLHACRIPEGGRGFCGLRRVHIGNLHLLGEDY